MKKIILKLTGAFLALFLICACAGKNNPAVDETQKFLQQKEKISQTVEEKNPEDAVEEILREMTLEETIEKCIDLIKQRMNDRAKSL